jgi:hypothetical protein
MFEEVTEQPVAFLLGAAPIAFYLMCSMLPYFRPLGLFVRITFNHHQLKQ